MRASKLTSLLQGPSHKHVYVVVRVGGIRVGKGNRPNVGLAGLVPSACAELDVRWHVLSKRERGRERDKQGTNGECESPNSGKHPQSHQ